jgi:hypothetical protein
MSKKLIDDANPTQVEAGIEFLRRCLPGPSCKFVNSMYLAILANVSHDAIIAAADAIGLPIRRGRVDLAEYLNVTVMCIWRWQHDPELGFPQPTRINDISYTSARPWTRGCAAGSPIWPSGPQKKNESDVSTPTTAAGSLPYGNMDAGGWHRGHV